MSSNLDQVSNEATLRVEPYVYPPPFPLDPGSPGNAPHTDQSVMEGLSQPATLVHSGTTEEQVEEREKRAWEMGAKEGESRARVECQKVLASQREALAQALKDFAKERDDYFARVETELVRLALAIARKILHREAQIDPLLLAGVVRVALEKVSAGTHVRLRVPPDQVKLWQDFFSQQPELQCEPELMGDPSLGVDHCLLEMELGSTDLTLETQLQEIEQGFFDLLAQRPRKHE